MIMAFIFGMFCGSICGFTICALVSANDKPCCSKVMGNDNVVIQNSKED